MLRSVETKIGMIRTQKYRWLKVLCFLSMICLFANPSIAGEEDEGVINDDSRKDPICYDETFNRIDGQGRLIPFFATQSKAVGTILNIGDNWEEDGTLTTNRSHRCTAFLISPGTLEDRNSLALTAAHCWPLSAHGLEFYFGSQKTSCGGADEIGTMHYYGGELLDFSWEMDVALYKLPGDAAIRDGLGWLALDPDTRLSALTDEDKGIYLLTPGTEAGLEDGVPRMAFDQDCRITDVPSDCPGLNTYYKKFRIEGIDPPEDACLKHRCDMTVGASGGPILSNTNSRVIAINQSNDPPDATDIWGKNVGVKIRNIYPWLIRYLPDMGDDDGDRMPNSRDNCPDVSNTGTCTGGRVGVINCLGDRECDTIFGADDGICEGSQEDDDGDNIGNACASLPPDNKEPNDLPFQAFVLSSGTYPLTIHDKWDTDFFLVNIPATTNSFKIVTAESSLRTLGMEIKYQDPGCEPTCGWNNAFGNLTKTNTGWTYEETGEVIPAGRKYQVMIYELDVKGPLAYILTVHVGGEALPPDPNEPNNDKATGTALSGCDFTGLINIHDASDLDYYKLDATGYSVKAEISFSPIEGELDLSLDDVQATETTLSPDETKKTIRITGCGQSQSFVKVQGQPNFYNICVNRVTLQPGCPDYIAPDTLKGSGTFTFTEQICGPLPPGQQPPENTANVRDQMYAVITSESATEVFWSVAAWLQYTNGNTAPLVVELHCQKGTLTNAASVTMKILTQTLDKIVWSGTGQGQCYGPTNAITGFIASANLNSALSWECVEPGHGTLTIEGYKDTDNDGIPDHVEIDTGTDPNSDDTDGDGIPDGEEDANHNGQVDYLTGETDPRLWDTDGDGVCDGVERGLTSSHGNDTDLSKFIPDLDPATTTDPTKKDTDGDGMSDGEEDANHNGRVDPGETSPIVSNFVAAPDLIVESLTHSPASPTTLSSITFTAVVKNVGNAQAGSSTLNFKVGGETFGQDFVIPELAPGESFTLQRQELLEVAQNYRNTVTADSNNEVTEAREDNNQETDDYTVTRAGNLDGDNDIDQNDLNILLSFRNQPASACPACDLDGDGMITVLDSRKLVLLCTRLRCATQ